MIFDMPIGSAEKSKDKDIRSEWARQKVYHLVGEYARSADPSLLKEINSTARSYNVPIPHQGKF